ncbi:MAG TPA: hypothetical protein VE736_03760 [Gaiellaceae bacterium]|nr:hypothetical protein [Gaiellaceae bacterium]
MRFELPGASLRFRALDERATRIVRTELDPYVPTTTDEDADADLDVVSTDQLALRFADIQNPAGDGRVTASDGSRLYLLEGDRACSLPRFDTGTPYRFECMPDFPLRALMRAVLRPALQLAMLDHDTVVVHGATVEHDGRGTVVAGWSESGKTETALAFLEQGARFVSDKWTVLPNGARVSPFPISVGVRRWVLPFLPRLRRELPRSARAQLLAAAAASAVTRPLRRARMTGPIGRTAAAAASRAVALADRAALTPSQLARAYGADRPLETAPLRALVFLTTVSDDNVSARVSDAVTIARRLARSASYERGPFFDLLRRMRFSLADVSAEFELSVERREEELLTKRLEGVNLLDVHAPFPTDPRRVADAIAAWL